MSPFWRRQKASDPMIAAHQPRRPTNRASWANPPLCNRRSRNPLANRLRGVWSKPTENRSYFYYRITLPQARRRLQQQVTSEITFSYSPGPDTIEFAIDPRGMGVSRRGFRRVATPRRKRIVGLDFFYRSSSIKPMFAPMSQNSNATRFARRLNRRRLPCFT